MPTRVVIAEDEAIIRLDLKETLEEEGYEVVAETGRGDEASAGSHNGRSPHEQPSRGQREQRHAER